MIKKNSRNQTPDLKSLSDVEIFAAGKWNGDNYTTEDLDDMVHAFNQTKDQFEPFVKIGHDNKQSLLNAENLPAAGYVKNLRRVGEKLLADFVDIPEKVYFLMKNKAYKSRSSEIFWDIEFNGRKFKRMLKAVALLGAEMPGVATLGDIINFYGLDAKKTRDETNSSVILKICNFHESTKDEDMSDELKKRIAELEKENAAKEKNYSAKVDALKAKEDEIKAKEDEIKKYQKREAEALAKAKDQEIKNFSASLVSEKLATPGMKPLIEAIFGDDAKEYSIDRVVKKEDGEEETHSKKYSDKKEMFKEVMKLYKEASSVNFDENSDDVTPPKGDKDDLLNQKVEKYASENEVSYADAYKEVMRNEKQD